MNSTCYGALSCSFLNHTSLMISSRRLRNNSLLSIKQQIQFHQIYNFSSPKMKGEQRADGRGTSSINHKQKGSTNETRTVKVQLEEKKKKIQRRTILAVHQAPATKGFIISLMNNINYLRKSFQLACFFSWPSA